MSDNNVEKLTEWQKMKDRGYSAIHILVREEHKQKLEAEAEELGLELTVYVRGLILGKENRKLKPKQRKAIVNA